MPEVLSWIQEIRKKLNSAIKKMDYMLIYEYASDLIAHLEFLGFRLENIHSRENRDLILKWNELTKEKRYGKADEIRRVLMERGLI